METHERKKLITHYFDNISNTRDYWIKKNQSFYDEDRAFMKFLVEPNLNILDIGCGTGDLLSSMKPKYGMGIDISPKMIEIAKQRHPTSKFLVGDIENENFVSKIKKI